jgi:dihydrodipicolinate synthase/N-acetylneuraminate lyase
MLLEGLQLPLTTPFYPDGRLNLRKLEHNVGAYSKTPAAGLAVLGQNGEPTALSDDETKQVLKTAIQAAAAHKVMLAGASCDSVLGTLDRTDYATHLGYDAVLLRRPSYLRTKDSAQESRELLTYFHAVADRSAIPIVLSSSSVAPDGLLPAEVVIELAAHPRILGLVDSGLADGHSTSARIAALREATGYVKRDVTVTATFAAVTGRMLARQQSAATGNMLTADMLTGGGAALAVAPPTPALKTRTKVVGFQLLAGSTTQMLDGLLAGAVGAMSAFAACTPQACYEVYAAWKDGDQGLAEEKQARLQAAANKIEGQFGVAGIKFGCDFNGYFGGVPRLPLLPPTGDQRNEIEALMESLRT